MRVIGRRVCVCGWTARRGETAMGAAMGWRRRDTRMGRIVPRISMPLGPHRRARVSDAWTPRRRSCSSSARNGLRRLLPYWGSVVGFASFLVARRFFRRERALGRVLLEPRDLGVQLEQLMPQLGPAVRLARRDVEMRGDAVRSSSRGTSQSIAASARAGRVRRRRTASAS